MNGGKALVKENWLKGFQDYLNGEGVVMAFLVLKKISGTLFSKFGCLWFLCQVPEVFSSLLVSESKSLAMPVCLSFLFFLLLNCFLSLPSICFSYFLCYHPKTPFSFVTNGFSRDNLSGETGWAGVGFAG